jgi:2-oxoglutarate ferredoxin oxidoreductase subunit beta
MSTEATTLTKKDFQTDQEVRWCPGCGDYAILSAVQALFPELGIPREKLVIVSGIGCSSRFPYYMNTYGFHTIHGRAPAVATGLKLTRPDLHVWVVTGNQIYGLTKGQYSPTSEPGKRTKSTPVGSIDAPFNPLAVALGAGATFVARSVDIFQAHLKETLRRAAEHQGTAFIEIYQNCNIFNDKAFAYLTEKEARSENGLYLEHGKPLVFGKERQRGLRLNGPDLEVVDLDGATVTEADCLVWDERRVNPGLAFQLASVDHSFPVPLGVLRCVEEPVYETEVIAQIRSEEERRGTPKLEDLIHSGDVWEVAAR